MSRIRLVQADISTLDVDAIVNTVDFASVLGGETRELGAP